MHIPYKALLARVGDDSVDDILLLARYGWYLVAALQLLTLLFAGLAGRMAGGDVVDPIVSALGGWFLLKTHSRAVAGALLLYAIVTAALCVAKFLGLAGNGVPLLTSAIALYAGVRGWTATQFWQKRACAIPAWRHVALGAVLAFIITLVTLGLALGLLGEDGPATLREFLISAVLFLVPVAVLIWFTRRRGFATNDPACPWPPKT